jgi:hypothetical protein
MLPPIELQSKCLRCGARLAIDDTVCRACGADPVVEREIYAQLTPAIRSLRAVFLGVLVVGGISSWLVYDHLEHVGVDAMPLVWPMIAICGLMGVLWIFAPRAPLACALIGWLLFSGDWLREILRDRVWALDPSPLLALRAIVVIALGFAVRAGLTARRLRVRSVPHAHALQA